MRQGGVPKACSAPVCSQKILEPNDADKAINAPEKLRGKPTHVRTSSMNLSRLKPSEARLDREPCLGRIGRKLFGVISCKLGEQSDILA